MKEGTVRPATDQGKLLLHTVYKVWGSIVENEVTNREKQAVLEAITSIPDEQLRDFRDGDKLVRVKQHIRKGVPTEWVAEAVAWCDNAFNIIQDIYLLLKDIKEFRMLPGAFGMAETTESRDAAAPQTAPIMKGNRKRRPDKAVNSE